MRKRGLQKAFSPGRKAPRAPIWGIRGEKGSPVGGKYQARVADPDRGAFLAVREQADRRFYVTKTWQNRA